MASAKALNADLGTLEGRSLEADLPDVRVALEPVEMASKFRDALLRDRSAMVADCCLVSAILIPGDSVVVRYEIEVATPSGGSSRLLVTGRVFPDTARATSYVDLKLTPLIAQVRDREELAPLDAPVALLPGLAMVVYAYPLDGDLPTLAAATDPAVAGPVLADLLRRNGRQDVGVADCRVEPAHYNRRHRCMLRYHLDMTAGTKIRLYGKVANDGSGERSAAVVAALRPPLTAAGVSVPECLGFVPELQLVAFSEIPGLPVVAALLKARLNREPSPDGQALESAVESCATIAARLHTSDLHVGDERPFSVEIARLRADVVPMRRLAPDLADQLTEVLDVIERLGDASPAMRLRQCHGDFSYTQLIFDGSRPGLVDFDNFCLAEPALDLGQFLAYLRYAGTKATASPDESSRLTETLAELFLTAYVGSGGPPEALARVGLYEAINLVRMAEHAWHNLKSRRLRETVALLQRRLPR